jgi:hemerythrin
MDLEWQSDYETGNEYVDLQHRYFVDLIKRVGINFSETNDAAYKEKLILELRKYADFHFTSEENIATSCNLQGVSSHHQRHLELLEEFNHHAEDLNKGSKKADEFLEFLTDWLIGHTIYEDKKLFKAI